MPLSPWANHNSTPLVTTQEPLTTVDLQWSWQRADKNWFALGLLPLVVFGITGNVLVCLAILTDKKLQNITNYFLVSLTVADLLVCCLVMPCSILNELMGFWPFGLLLCDFFQVTDVMMCTSSIMHMCAISIDRYFTMSNPLKTRNKRPISVALKITAVWLLSFAVACPLLLLIFLAPDDLLLRETLACGIFNKHFLIYGSLAAFFIPLVMMSVAYTLTIRLLQKQYHITQTSGMLRSTSNKKFFPRGKKPAVSRRQSSSDSPSDQTSNNRDRLDKIVFRNSKGLIYDTFELEPLNWHSHRKVSDVSNITNFTSYSASPRPSMVRQPSDDQPDNAFLQPYTGTRTSRLSLGNIQKRTQGSNGSISNQSSPIGRASPQRESLRRVSFGSLPQKYHRKKSCCSSIEVLDAALSVSQGIPVGNAYTRAREAAVQHCLSQGDITVERLGETCCKSPYASSFTSKVQQPLQFSVEIPLGTQTLVCPEDINDAGCSEVKSDQLSTEQEKVTCNANHSAEVPEHCVEVHRSPQATPRQSLKSHSRDEETGEVPSTPQCSPTNCCDDLQCIPEHSITETIMAGGECSTSAHCVSTANHQKETPDRPALVLQTRSSPVIETISPQQCQDLKSPPNPTKSTPVSGFLRTDLPQSNLSLPSASLGTYSIPNTAASTPARNLKFRELVKKHQAVIKVAGIMMAKREEKNKVQTERKAIKVLGTMFVVFVICWLPFFLTNFIMGVCSPNCDVPELLFKVFVWLGYLSSTLNPLIYTTFNKLFREAFLRLLTCKQWRRPQPAEAAPAWVNSSRRPSHRSPVKPHILYKPYAAANGRATEEDFNQIQREEKILKTQCQTLYASIKESDL